MFNDMDVTISTETDRCHRPVVKLITSTHDISMFLLIISTNFLIIIPVPFFTTKRHNISANTNQPVSSSMPYTVFIRIDTTQKTSTIIMFVQG